MYKRVNVFLLVLMCFLVIGLGGTTIYFQESFKNLNLKYESVVGNFSACKNVLSVKEQKLNECVEDLNTTEQDIGKYDTLYEQKAAELEQTKNELMATDKELKKTKLALAQAQNKYQLELKRTSELEKQISFLNQQIVDLQGRINALEDQLGQCEANCQP